MSFISATLATAATAIGVLAVLRMRALDQKANKPTNNSKAKKKYVRVPLDQLLPPKNDLILRAARGEAVERVPVWMMRQAGRYLPEFRAERKKADFFTICRTPELAMLVSIQPLERFKELDAVIIFSDILIIPQAMGMEVLMVPGRGPVFPEPLVTPADFKKLIMSPNVEDTLGYVFDAVNLTRVHIAGRVPLIGFAGAPFTLMGYMIEGGGSKTLSKVKSWLYCYPDETHQLLQALTDIVVEYLVGKVRAGAHLLQVFESNAGDLSPAHFERFSLPYLAQIAKRVKAELKKQGLPDTPMTVFARGANQQGSLEALAETEYDVISLDWCMTSAEARSRVDPSKSALQGNLDPCALYASKDNIRSLVSEMLQGFGTTRSLIANLGHGMHPDHDPEHAGAFIDAVHEVSARMVREQAGTLPK